MEKNFFFLIAIAILHVKADGEKSVVVDVYPGFGWDDLRFMDMSPIFDVSNFNNSNKFQSCIEVIPVYHNRIQLDSTVIDMFDARTSDFSSNLFVSGGGGFWKISAKGSYSQQYQSAKRQQGEEKTIAIRNQIDYIMYDVILTSSCQLNPQVKKALIEISQYQTSDETMMAKYAAQLFIKTYGTHFTSRFSLGGSIVQEDYIRKSAYYQEQSQTQKYRAAASASFLKTFKVSGNFDSTATDTSVSNVTKEFTRKIIRANGGKIDLSDGAIESWQLSVDSKPVIVRRAIENITFFIQSDKIPELSEIELGNVRDELNEAVETYIEMNVYSGCMNRTSPSFNWVANVDDGSCIPVDENSQFGGFIRTCTEDGRLNQKCGQYRIRNYYTNTEECPSSFDKYLLRESIQTENIFTRQCRSCGFLGLKKCCKDVVAGVGQRKLSFYGCNGKKSQLKSSDGALKIANNYVFGGSFTKDKVNPVTSFQGCPNEQFQAVTVINELKVCLAERVLDTDGLPHYGGIYSCDQGNIAFETSKKECSDGYSAYVMGAIEESCLLHVCLKFDKFSDIRQLPSIVLPPFFSISLPNQTRGSDASNLNQEDTVTTPSTPKSNDLTFGLSIGGASIGILVAILIVFLLIQNKRLQRQIKQRNDIHLERRTNNSAF